MTTHPESEDDSDRKKLVEAAQKAWLEVWERATPRERRDFVNQGIVTIKDGKPKFIDDSHKVAGHNPHEEQDAAESSRSSEGFCFEKLDKGQLAGALMETFPGLPPGISAKIATWHTESVRAAVRKRNSVDLSRAIGPLISAANPKMSIAGLAFALNLGALNGLGSIRQWAEKEGVSPEALSKKKRQWEDELDLDPGPHGKTKKARTALSNAQMKKHYTKKKFSKKKPTL